MDLKPQTKSLIMKYISFLLLAIFSCANITAQTDLDIFTLSGRYGFPQEYETTYSEKATETGILANLQMPVPFSESTIWYSQLTFNNFRVNNDITMPAEIANPINVSGFILQTGLYKKFSKGRGMQILLAPRFMTDFNNVDGGHFQFGGVALYEKRFHDKLMMRFGAMLHDELGGLYMVPIVYTDWQISSKWSLKGNWPISGKIKYQVNDNLSTGISHFGLITSYKLGHPDYQGDYMERTSIDECLFARVRIVGNIHLEGRLGYALGRYYKQYDADQKADFRITILKFGDNRVEKNVNFKSGPIALLRLVYNLPL
jgi:hypothetical protein